MLGKREDAVDWPVWGSEEVEEVEIGAEVDQGMGDVSKEDLLLGKMLDQKGDVVEIRCVLAPVDVLLLVELRSVVVILLGWTVEWDVIAASAVVNSVEM